MLFLRIMWNYQQSLKKSNQAFQNSYKNESNKVGYMKKIIDTLQTKSLNLS